MKQKELAPLTIQCAECNQEFTFSVGEQEFYAEKGFTPPKRCSKCRTARKVRRESERD